MQRERTDSSGLVEPRVLIRVFWNQGSSTTASSSTRNCRALKLTLLVDDVQPYYDRLVAEGAEILFPLQHVPTGAAFNARHPDGTVVEYVHHRPTEDAH